jgi:hypothetical protein
VSHANSWSHSTGSGSDRCGLRRLWITTLFSKVSASKSPSGIKGTDLRNQTVPIQSSVSFRVRDRGLGWGGGRDGMVGKVDVAAPSLGGPVVVQQSAVRVISGWRKSTRWKIW